MDARIPSKPNPFLTDYLRGGECRGIITERTNTALMMYQAEVAKRSAALAKSAHATVEIGGVQHDRWVGTLTVGELGIADDYVLPHEFGADDRYDANRGDPTFDETEGARDLNFVLESLIWVPL
ncbi:MAG: hypothetical protein K2Y33_09310 [Mycolicibacterium frederiksbergense]|nr:hypothetical protein [Mycolicibacterium frederiksbergense]